MSRTETLRRVLVACTALAAAGTAFAHPGHANPGPWSDIAHYVWHVFADAAPLLAAIPVVLLLRAAWQARRDGTPKTPRRTPRD